MVDQRSQVKCEFAKTKKLLKQLARTGFLFFSDLVNSSPNMIEMYDIRQRISGSQTMERLDIGSINAKTKRAVYAFYYRVRDLNNSFSFPLSDNLK